MLNYCAEVWGLDADHTPIERVHLFALKRFLNTSLRTPNLMVYVEKGRYPLFVNIYVKCIQIWLRILKMPHCRLPFKAYKMLLHLQDQNKRTWVSSVCYALYKYDFGCVWVNQGFGDEKALLKEFKERVASIPTTTRMEQQFKHQRTFYRLQYFQVVLIPGTVPE